MIYIMKKFSKILAFAAIALGVSSCFKDLGNYDYIEFDNFEVKELENSYSVISFRDNLKIEPEIISKATDFEYRWFITRKDNEGKEVVDTLSREKVLDVPFEYKTGQYPIYLRVQNVESGAAKFVSSVVRCTTPFLDAFYILKETTDGNTELDIHYPSGEPSVNMIEKTIGAPLQGKPKSLSYNPFFSYLDQEIGENVIDDLLIPASETDRVSFRLSDMNVARSNDEWFYSPYPSSKIRYSLTMWAGVIIMTDDGMHQNYQVPAWGMLTSGIFSDVPNRTEDEQGSFYDVSSDVCVSNDGGFSNAFFYDKRTNQFINIDFNSTPRHCNLMNGELVENLEGEVVDLVGSSLDGPRMFIICERENGSRYCYYTNAEETNKIDLLKKFEFGAFEEFSKSEMYAGCRKGGNILYSVYKNKVYAFNPASEQSDVLDFVDLPAGDIVYLDTMNFIVDGEESISFNYLLVGLDNAGKYSLAMYDMVGGIPVKDEGPVRVINGEGRIKTVQYVNALKNGNTSGEWSIHY